MSRNVVIAFLLWTLVLGAGAYFTGRYHQEIAEQAQRTEEVEGKNEQLRLLNRRSLAAGVRTEKKQAKTDHFFQQLRADYETDQREDPAIGCVLDPVSLRRWNQANTESDSATAGESAAGMPGDAADLEAGRERGQQPHRVGADVPHVQEQGGGLD